MLPRVYRSFREFERSELQKLDQFGGGSSVDDANEDALMGELDEDQGGGDDGILFDDPTAF